MAQSRENVETKVTQREVQMGEARKGCMGSEMFVSCEEYN